MHLINLIPLEIEYDFTGRAPVPDPHAVTVELGLGNAHLTCSLGENIIDQSWREYKEETPG